jgi:hypothetical protein
MTEWPLLYLIAAAALVGVCAVFHRRRQAGPLILARHTAPYATAFAAFAIVGVAVRNYPYLKLWLEGEELSFVGVTPFGMPWQLFYFGSLGVLVIPVISLAPPILRRPWLVACIALIATAPISYARLMGGC